MSSNIPDPYAKDCDCLDAIHTGAHWLHMNEFDFDHNLRHLRETGGVDGFLVEEMARLNRLLFELGSRKIGTVKAEDLPPGYTTEEDKTARTLEVVRELRAKGVSPR